MEIHALMEHTSLQDLSVGLLDSLMVEDPDLLPGPLEVEVVECLTKEKEGYKPWCKNWRVRVPQKHKQHMMRPEALPEGWTSRRFYPARAPRPPPPPAHGLPTAAQVAVVTAATAAAGQPAAGQHGHLPPGANYKQ